MTVRHVSLFDAEDEEVAPRVRDCTVGPASTQEVDEFCNRYHYTATGGNMTWRYGLWHGPTLWGVVAYNLPTRVVCESVFGPAHGPDHVWHMGRLVLPDHALRNSESRLIGGSLNLIARDYPDIWAIVTYAATDAGHIGYVYQATNALYTGTAELLRRDLVDEQGRRRSPVNGGKWISREEAAERGWSVLEPAPKHRYIYILGDRRQRRERRAMLRFPVLPYPKAST